MGELRAEYAWQISKIKSELEMRLEIAQRKEAERGGEGGGGEGGRGGGGGGSGGGGGGKRKREEEEEQEDEKEEGGGGGGRSSPSALDVEMLPEKLKEEMIKEDELMRAVDLKEEEALINRFGYERAHPYLVDLKEVGGKGREKRRDPTSSLYDPFYAVSKEELEAFAKKCYDGYNNSSEWGEGEAAKERMDIGWRKVRDFWLRLKNNSNFPFEIDETNWEQGVKPKISLKPDTPLKVAGIGIDLPFYKRVLSHMDRPEWWVFDRHVKLTRASAPEAFGKDFIDSKFVIHNE